MVTPAVKREAVAHLKGAHGMSERRACMAIACDRMTVRYRSRRPDDRVLRERLRALARERRRFGYRRLLIFLRRENEYILPIRIDDTELEGLLPTINYLTVSGRHFPISISV